MFLVDFIPYIDQHLAEFVANYGIWINASLCFLIVFVETGLSGDAFSFFTPRDSLLFAAGALAAIGQMNPAILSLNHFYCCRLETRSNYRVE